MSTTNSTTSSQNDSKNKKNLVSRLETRNKETREQELEKLRQLQNRYKNQKQRSTTNQILNIYKTPSTKNDQSSRLDYLRTLVNSSKIDTSKSKENSNITTNTTKTTRTISNIKPKIKKNLIDHNSQNQKKTLKKLEKTNSSLLLIQINPKISNTSLNQGHYLTRFQSGEPFIVDDNYLKNSNDSTKGMNGKANSHFEHQSRVKQLHKYLDKELPTILPSEMALPKEMLDCCIQDLDLSTQILKPLIEQHKKELRSLESMAQLYTNKKKEFSATNEVIIEERTKINTLKLFQNLVYRNWSKLITNEEIFDNSHAITLIDYQGKTHKEISFKRGQLIKVLIKKKLNSKKKKKNFENLQCIIQEQTGLVNTEHIKFIKVNILDEIIFENKKYKPPIPKIPKKINWKYLNIFEIDPEETARQISIREFETFSKIDLTELLRQSWNKKSLFKRAPNARYMIKRFNTFSFWCCTMILQSQKLTQRANSIEYFITVADHLRKFNNFNCLMAIVSALNSNPIQRLKYTMDEITEVMAQKLLSFDNLLSSESSFKNYRIELKRAYDRKESAIPFLGIHLTDLTFLDETRSKEDKSEKGKSHKMKVMILAIMEILKFQTHPYNFKAIPQIQQYFKDYPSLNEEQLYQKSLQREPRGVTFEELD
ncbi:guanine nucleotide exchange factor [Anaeramoeba flamelloides]|uniref:Guanine nucleotide exchange factor n=1 Tax=Anaeramoeba flamelloides TaxID=1746091 RepID=A0ABQ8YK24_9EUKA|nr:guanine nucleotide exchange factor [Anaeramoeba flamelloides]